MISTKHNKGVPVMQNISSPLATTLQRHTEPYLLFSHMYKHIM